MCNVCNNKISYNCGTHLHTPFVITLIHLHCSALQAQVVQSQVQSFVLLLFNEFKLGNYMSDYDVEIARKIAYVLCGGDLTQSQEVSEQYLLDIEGQAFLELLKNQKTLDRIQYMLMNNKPLRN